MDAVQCRAMCAHDECEKQQIEGGKQKISDMGGGWTSFTSKPSPKFCYKVDVSSAILGEVRLSYPHEAKDQWVIEDVAGDNTLWNERNLKVA